MAELPPVPKPDALLSIQEAIDFMARLMYPYLKTNKQELRRVKDNFRGQIEYANEKGWLKLNAKKQVVFADLTTWMHGRKAYQDKMVGLPLNAAVQLEGASTTLSIGDTLAISLPEKVEELQQIAIADRLELAKLKKEKAALNEENQRLHRLEEIDRKRREDARKAGKKGRGIPKYRSDS